MNPRETMEKYLETAFSRQKLLGELLNPGCCFFLMYFDGKLCGYLKLNEPPAQSDLNDPQSLEVERLYVKYEFQGKGLGRALMNYSIQVARESAKRYVWLGVWEKNTNAISFYHEMGFVLAGHHTFRMGDEPQRDLIMKKELVDQKGLSAQLG
jgi:ribosomal protein S18 acetylase RimI-like enzyme